MYVSILAPDYIMDMIQTVSDTITPHSLHENMIKHRTVVLCLHKVCWHLTVCCACGP